MSASSYALAAAVAAACTSTVLGAQIVALVDGTVTGATADGIIGSNEYSASYTASPPPGTSFGGILSNGSIKFDSTQTDLQIGLDTPGVGGNVPLVYLNTRSGGFTSTSQINDPNTGDAARRELSRLATNPDETLPFEADFGLARVGNFFGIFELQSGSFNFVTSGTTNGDSAEISIPFASLGLSPGDRVDFVTLLTNGEGFLASEAIPSQGYFDNPGDGITGQPIPVSNFNSFTVIPEPLAAGAGGLLGLVALRRRW